MKSKTEREKKLEAERLENWDNGKDILELLNVVKEGHILEIGCGTGRIIEDLSKRLLNSSFVGTDISEYFINIAKKKDIKKAKFITARATERIFSPNSFDCVILRDALHEIRESEGKEGVKRMLKNIYSYLKGSGLLVIRDGLVPDDKEIRVTFKNEESFKLFDSFLSKTSKKIKFSKNEFIININANDFIFFLSKLKKIQQNPNLKNIKQTKHYHLEEYRKLLKDCGFKEVSIKEYKFPFESFSEYFYVDQDKIPESYVMLVYKKTSIEP